MEERLAKAVKDRSWAVELLIAEQERSDEPSEELCTFQEQQRVSKKIWSEEVTQLRGQLLVQQQWLPMITCINLFKTVAFSDFLNQYAESSKASDITKAFDDVMEAHPSMNLITLTLFCRLTMI